MLHRYFVRVLDLRMEGRRMEVHLEEVEEQYTDLSKYVRNLAHSVQRAKLDGERKLLAQQREHQVMIICPFKIFKPILAHCNACR